MTDSGQRQRSSIWQMFGMLGAPVIWALHFTVAYALAAIACTARFASVSVLGLTALQALMLGTAAVAILGILWSSRVAYGNQQRTTRTDDEGEDTRTGRRAYMGRVGIILSIFFVALIVIETVPVFVVDACWRTT